MNPRVSIILPCYNRAHLLERAVASVLSQDFTDFELLLVDDGSTDDTPALVSRFSDPRLITLRREQGGPAAARNSGLSRARGEFVAFQDSDDVWLPGKLTRQLAALEQAKENTVLCVSGYRAQWDDGKLRHYGGHNLVAAGDIQRQVLEAFYFPTPSWLVRRRALESCGMFDETLACWEDWELSLRLAGEGRFILLDEELLLQHRSEHSVNNDARARLAALRRILARHENRWVALPRTLSEHWFSLGQMECLIGSPADGRRALRRSLTLNPDNRKARMALCCAWLGQGFYRRVHAWRRQLPRGHGDRSEILGPAIVRNRVNPDSSPSHAL
jgi:glycosyltransferase involved in cell wall biosynthesis